MKEMIWIELEVKILQVSSSDKPDHVKISFASECEELERALDAGEEFDDD